MFHCRVSNSKINFLHEGALRMIYNHQISSFQEFLDKDNSYTVHNFSIQSLAIKIFKVINNIATITTGNLFTTYHSYSFRSNSRFVVLSVPTFHNDQHPIQYYGPLIWNMTPGQVIDSGTLGIFKGKIRKWKPISCFSCLCKKYIPNLGSINQT